MPTVSRTTRLFKLMDALRAHRRPVTAARLAEDVSVSVRTIYRDIQTLMDLGAPVEGEAGLGYVLRAGFFLPPLMFDEEELEALVLGARWVRGQGDVCSCSGGRCGTRQNCDGLAQGFARQDGRYRTLRAAVQRTGWSCRRASNPYARRCVASASWPLRTSTTRELPPSGWYGRWRSPSSRASGCWRPGAKCAMAFDISVPTGLGRCA
jgi:biotin operon repressor